MNECDAASRIAERKTDVTLLTYCGHNLNNRLLSDVFLPALGALLTHVMCSREDKLIALIFMASGFFGGERQIKSLQIQKCTHRGQF